MSYVTSVVIACPAGWSSSQAEYLGRAVYESHKRLLDGENEVNYGYAPVPDDAAGGGKFPGGHVFWLGLNYAHMDELLSDLDDDGQCRGAWVWWQSEDDVTPLTHLVGAGRAESGA